MTTKLLSLFIATAFTGLLNGSVSAQNSFPSTGSAGIGTTAPDASAVLEMKSLTQGMLVPRMSAGQRGAIVSPATGLLVYQLKGASGFYYYNGSTWVQLGGAAGANLSLSNLTSPTAVNQSLVANTNNSYDLGSSTIRWRNLFMAGSVYFANVLGDKISLYDGSNSNYYGFSVVPTLLQIHTDSSVADIAFGSGRSDNFRETMRIKGNGYVGIGTSVPNVKLTVNVAGTGYGILHTNGLVSAGSYIGQTDAEYGTKSNHPLGFFTNNSKPQVTLLQNGNFGIGETNPNYKLTVKTGDTQWGLVHTDGDLKMGTIIGINGVEKVGEFGTESNHKLALFANNKTGIVIKPNDSVEIGYDNNNAIPFNTKIHGYASIDKLFSGNILCTQVQAVRNGSVGLAGNFLGDIFVAGQILTPVFTTALTEKMQPSFHALENILKLQTGTYYFKKEYGFLQLPLTKQNGFNAQSVENVFPDLVKDIKQYDLENSRVDSGTKIELKGIDYAGLIPILTAAIQEQHKNIEEKNIVTDKNIIGLQTKIADLQNSNNDKQQQIDALSKKLDDLISQLQLLAVNVSKCSNGASENSASADVTINTVIITDGISLEQNIPNPFTHSTSIGYCLPQKFSKAQVIITDKTGKTLLVKDISGSGKGRLNVDASVLASGAYNYSLIVDGKIAGTKQMVLTK